MKRKGLIAVTAFAMALGVGVAVSAHQNAEEVKAVDAGTVIYLDDSASGWFSDGAKVAIWNHQAIAFEEFTSDSESGLYKVTLANACTSFNLFRGSALNWENPYKWNQSDDGSFEDGKNMIVGIGYDSGKMIYSWGVYTPKSDPSAETYSFYVYDKEDHLVRDDSNNIKVYGYGQDSSTKAMTFPGIHSGILKVKVGEFDMYRVEISVSYPNFILTNKNEGAFQTPDIEDFYYVDNEVNKDHTDDVLVIYDSENYKWNPSAFYTDVPEEDGYYLLGTRNNWSFNDAVPAPKLGEGDEENHAKLLNFDVTKDEEFKVVGYFDSDRTYYGNDTDDGNCVIDETGSVNIFLSKSNNRVYVQKVVTPDVPSEGDGYYLVGSKSNWKFDGATKMSAGVGTDKAQLIAYSATAGETFKVRSYFDGVDAWISPEDHEVGAFDKKISVYVNATDEVFVEDYSSEEGYYLCGSFSGEAKWTYETAIKMSNTSASGNVAYKMNVSVAVDDEIRVRSYYTDQLPRNRWASPGNADDAEHMGVKSGDNFKFTVAGSYDIYAKYEGDDFKFYVAAHVDSFEIEMTAVKYAGGAKEGTSALDTQHAYAGEPFNAEQPALSGYVARGVYKDEACTDPYVPEEFLSAGHLYVKYTKVGYYVISESTGYSIDSAVLMSTEGIASGNKAETSLVVSDVTEGNDEYSFVFYNASGIEEGNAGLGAEYAYAEQVSTNVRFKETGTYAVYWSNGDNKIYLNNGLTAFFTTFETEVGGTCQGILDGKKNLDNLKAIWGDMKTLYGLVKDDDGKAALKALGFDHKPVDPEHPTDPEKFILKYNYVVSKYGTANCEDFVWEQTIEPVAYFETNEGFPTATIVIITLVSAAYLSFTALIVIKRKRSHK